MRPPPQYIMLLMLITLVMSSSVKHLRQQKRQLIAKTEYHFVVSHESFEAWLLAHFKDIRNKNIPRTTMGKNLQGRKMLNGSNNKNVSDDFPVEDYEQAVGRVTHCAFDEVNRETTSTAMPHLITELIKLKPKPK